MEPLTTIRYWAALKEAAGVAQERVVARTLEQALAEVRTRHDALFGTVLDRCSLLVDGVQVGAQDRAAVVLGPGVEVDCLPPFAGG